MNESTDIFRERLIVNLPSDCLRGRLIVNESTVVSVED